MNPFFLYRDIFPIGSKWRVIWICFSYTLYGQENSVCLSSLGVEDDHSTELAQVSCVRASLFDWCTNFRDICCRSFLDTPQLLHKWESLYFLPVPEQAGFAETACTTCDWRQHSHPRGVLLSAPLYCPFFKVFVTFSYFISSSCRENYKQNSRGRTIQQYIRWTCGKCWFSFFIILSALRHPKYSLRLCGRFWSASLFFACKVDGFMLEIMLSLWDPCLSY